MYTLRNYLYLEMLKSVGLDKDNLCRLFLLLREISSPFVIKLFILCMFLLNLIVLMGKHKSNNILKSSQNRSRLEFTSVELRTLFHDKLRSWLRNLSMLV